MASLRYDVIIKITFSHPRLYQMKNQGFKLFFRKIMPFNVVCLNQITSKCS